MSRRSQHDGPLALLVVVVGLNLALYLLRLEYSGALDDDVGAARVAWDGADAAAAPPFDARFDAAAPSPNADAAAAYADAVYAPPPPKVRPPPQNAKWQPAPEPGPTKKRPEPTDDSETLPPMYGDGPRVLGMEKCAAFRAARPAHLRRWAPAGMFNCGTNTLLSLMTKNCRFTRVGRHTLWQAPWGKHNPVAWRGRHWAPQFVKPGWRPDIDSVLAMVIKDPLTWMKSMCRNQYAARFRHHNAHFTAACPAPVAKTKTIVHYQYNVATPYDSLVHWWAAWNGAYLNASFPRLIVRFEDLLFDTERTVKTVCDCAGGTMTKRFSNEDSVSKDATLGHAGAVNDRGKALRLYRSEYERYRNYKAADLRFAATPPKLKQLADLFHYGFDAEPNAEPVKGRKGRKMLSANDTRQETSRR